jgi:lipoprotein-anchoring transpeptidase ErfK/SrfK
MIRNFLIYLAVLIAGALFFVGMVLFAIPKLQESTIVLLGLSSKSVSSTDGGEDESSIENEINKLQKELDSYTPTNPYMIINTNENHFYLYKGGSQLVRHGICSTGKNEKLVSAERKYEHIFQPPFGVRKILRKSTNPVWKKPDWSYIEDGLPIPGPNDPSRWETGTLGAYKLDMGEGFLIHGTIYKRRMGLSVTHGCTRLLDDDLEAVYKTMEIGSKVYIF